MDKAHQGNNPDKLVCDREVKFQRLERARGRGTAPQQDTPTGPWRGALDFYEAILCRVPIRVPQPAVTPSIRRRPTANRGTESLPTLEHRSFEGEFPIQ